MNNKSYSKIHTIANADYTNTYFPLILVLSLIVLASCNIRNEFVNQVGQENGIEKRNIFIKRNHKKLTNYFLPLLKLMDSLNLSPSDLYVLVDKSDYTLSLMAGNSLIKQYPVVLGRNPVDDKLKQGDFCTPEGHLKIIAKYKHKKWSRFIWIDYPNVESFRKIADAKSAGIIPKDSKPGGEIGIHGVPDNTDFAIDLGLNWTAGCIALKNKDIIEIFEFVRVETEVIIRK
jgi:murein L,D-transpeptidase YafK